MPNPLLEPPREQMEQAQEHLPADWLLEFRSMFGGMGVYAFSRIFATLSDSGIALKLTEGDRETLLLEPGACLWHPDPAMPPMKEYVVVPEKIATNPEELAHWMERSIGYARTLPPPKKRKKATE